MLPSRCGRTRLLTYAVFKASELSRGAPGYEPSCGAQFVVRAAHERARLRAAHDCRGIAEGIFGNCSATYYTCARIAEDNLKRHDLRLTQGDDMTPGPARRAVIAIGAGIGAVTCLVAGQSWIYENVERPGARALCDGRCGMDPNPTDTMFAFPLAVLAAFTIAVLLGIAVLRSRPPGRLFRASLFVAVVVASASSILVLDRTDWLRGADVLAVCNAYPGQPAPENPTRCTPEHEPASAAWLLAAGVLLVIGVVASAGSTGREVRMTGKTALVR